MNNVGFKGFTKPASISAELVEKKIQTMATENLFVIYTGGRYRGRKGSGRMASLMTVTEVKTPVPLVDLIRRAAKAHGDKGYTPDTVRNGLFLHRGSKPAVYLAATRREDGAFVAAVDTPMADGFGKNGGYGPLKEGDVILPAGTKPAAQKKIAAPKAPKGKSVAKK